MADRRSRPMQLPDFLRTERRKRGWTQRDVANVIGVTDNTVGTWERSEDPAIPSTYQIRSLADLFGVSADRLLSMLPPEPERRAAAES